MTTGIKKVSCSSMDNTQYKVEFENGSVVFVPMAEGNRDYQLIKTYLSEESGVVEEFEFAVNVKKEALIEKIQQKKIDCRVVRYERDVEKLDDIIVPVNSYLVDLITKQALFCERKKQRKLPYSFSLRDEKTNVVLFSITSDYSKNTPPKFDSFEFLFSLLSKLEDQLMSPNYQLASDLIISVNKCTTVAEIEEIEKKLDFSKFINGLVLKQSDFN
jgi:hypothetical protein